MQYGFASVCIHPYYVPLASKLMGCSPVKVCTVIGFPLGCNAWEVKVLEAQKAVSDGATEIDMVMNMSAFKNGKYEGVRNDIKSVIDSVPNNILVKVILETCHLSEKEIK